eukprot:8899185-Alexandrium_andersonii.AAC.1
MKPEKQKSYLNGQKAPDSNDYRKFHRAMAIGGGEVPITFKKQYEETMSLRSSKGKSVGKEQALRNLCKRW